MIYQFMVRRGGGKETLFLEASTEARAFEVMEKYCAQKNIKHLGIIKPWLAADESILGPKAEVKPAAELQKGVLDRVKQAVGA